MLRRYAADVLVFGHTHKSVVHRDPSGRLVVNPGAAGPRRFNLKPSVARLTITDRHAEVELIVLDGGGSGGHRHSSPRRSGPTALLILLHFALSLV